MAVNAPPGGPLPYPADQQALWDQLDARPVVPIYTDLITVDTKVVDGPGILMGVSYQNGGSNDWQLFDGRDSTGVVVARLSLAAAGKDQFECGTDGVFFTRGLFAHTVSGGIRLTVWVKL